MKKSLFTLVLILTLLSCGKNKRNSPFSIISFDMKEKPLKLSEICDTITYLRLETKEESLLGLVQKLRFSNLGYYFLSGFNQEKIVGFDKKTGKHILTINKNGKGPGEYIRASDIFVDPNNNFIEIYSRGTKKILNYYTDGNFSYEKKVDYYIGSFCKINTGYYIDIEGRGGEKIISYISGSNDLTKIFELPDYSIGDYNNFSVFGDTISFGCSINKFIYYLDKKKAYIKYKLNFGKYNIPDKILEHEFSDYQELRKTLNKYEFAYNLFSIYESSNFIVTTVYFHKKKNLAVYCKRTGNSRISSDIIDDINGLDKNMKIESGFLPLALDDNELIFVMEPLLFKDMINNQIKGNTLKNQHINDTLENLVRNSKDDDNPILMRCRLRMF